MTTPPNADMNNDRKRIEERHRRGTSRIALLALAALTMLSVVSITVLTLIPAIWIDADTVVIPQVLTTVALIGMGALASLMGDQKASGQSRHVDIDDDDRESSA